MVQEAYRVLRVAEPLELTARLCDRGGSPPALLEHQYLSSTVKPSYVDLLH